MSTHCQLQTAEAKGVEGQEDEYKTQENSYLAPVSKIELQVKTATKYSKLGGGCAIVLHNFAQESNCYKCIFFRYSMVHFFFLEIPFTRWGNHAKLITTMTGGFLHTDGTVKGMDFFLLFSQ